MVTSSAAVPPCYNFNFNESNWETENYCGTSDIGSTFGYHSSNNALSVSGDDTCINGGLAYIPISLQYDKFYKVTAWVNGDLADQGTPLVLFVSPGFGFPFSGRVFKNELGGSGWHKVTFFVMNFPTPIPPGEAINPHNLFFGAGLMNGFASDGNAAQGRWVVDDIEIREILIVE
jgi:hypothetical protein